MRVSFIVNVPKLKTTQEGQTYCSQLAEQIVDSSVNDDLSIESIQYSVPKQKGQS